MGGRGSVSDLVLAASWPVGPTLEVLDTHRWMVRGAFPPFI